MILYYAALESVILPNNQFLRWFMLKYGIIDSGRVDNTITWIFHGTENSKHFKNYITE